MTDTFTWRVTTESSGGGDFLVNTAKFGDGYSQKSPMGLNNDRQKWSVVFAGSREECQEVLDFIRDKQGSESFYWTPPLGVQGYYQCIAYKPNNVGGMQYTLSMEFEQSYFP